MSIKSLLDDEIRNEIENLKDLETGTEKHKTSVEALAKLLDRSIEMDRIDYELQEKYDSREAENELKEKQIEQERKDQLIKNCLTATSIFGGFALTVWGTYKSFEFEKEGTITTIMGRGFINKLLPKK